jgi:hypothetical protein
MNVYILRSNIVKTQNKLLGKIQNNQQNLNYLRDLESWGSLEILKASDTHIEYRLIQA